MVEFIKNTTQKVFDVALVHKGNLIYVEDKATGCNWRGMVTYVSPEKITLLYLPGISNVTNMKDLFAAEVADGNYIIRVSSDMSEVYSYETEETVNDA